MSGENTSGGNKREKRRSNTPKKRPSLAGKKSISSNSLKELTIIQEGSVRSLTRQFSQLQDTISQDDVLSLPEAKMRARYGYPASYLRDCNEQLKFGFLQTARAKLWKEVNTVHEDSAFKSTGIADKSAVFGSAEAGKVLSSHDLPEEYFAAIDRERAILKADGKKYPLPDCVYPLPDYMKDLNGNIQFVTFERQTLQTIEAKIATGYYRIIQDGIRKNTGVHYRIIADQVGGVFKLEYDPANFVDLKFATGSPVSVKERKTLKQAQSNRALITRDNYKDPRTIIKVYDKVTNKFDGSSRLEVVVTYPSFAKLERLVAVNPDSSIVLQRIDHSVPYILCSATGKPIKGDVDLQDALVPNDLPLMAYACIDKNETHDVNALKDLMREYRQQLLTLIKQKSKMSSKYIAIIKDIQQAIENLEKIQMERAKIAGHGFAKENAGYSAKSTDEIILDEIGVLKLSDAILLFAKQNGVLHGNDSFSPVKPENFAVTHIPDPKNPGKNLIAHGEFEYLKILLNNPEICNNKLKDFNLCHLIVDERLDWRKNLKDSVCPEDNKVHEYLNQNDQFHCVKMHRLLMERQLLRCKLDFTPERYDAYIEIVRKNYAIMIKKIKLKGADKVALEASMREGLKVAEAIIAKVANYNDLKDVKARLQEISDITTPDHYLSIKAKLSEVSLYYYQTATPQLPIRRI